VKWRILILQAAALAVCGDAWGNVGNKAQWKPEFTVDVQAPPPANAEDRAKAFAERNSKESLEKLAKEFFGMMDMGRVSKATRELYQKNDFEGALNAYRDFFVDRLRLPPPEFQIQPRNPTESHYPFLNTPDDLLKHIVTFGMINRPFPADIRSMSAAYSFMNSRDNKKGNVRIDIGPPGRVNWTWQPEAYTGIGEPRVPYEASFTSRCYGVPTFFSPLLAAYAESQGRAKLPLSRWCEFTDDASMNWRRDTVRAGFDATHPVNSIEGYTTLGVLPNLCYLARTMPDFQKDLPGPTLARLLLRIWKDHVPESLRSSRNTSSARRLVFYMWHAFRLAVSLPEFRAASDYCIREYVRILESYATVSTMPDGVDIHDSRNYNKIYMKEAMETFQLLCRLRNRPPWINALWHQELAENLNQAARFIIRELWVNGGYSQWGPLRPESWVFTGTDPYWLSCVPEALAEPDNARIISALFGDGSAGASPSQAGSAGASPSQPPSFTSDSFPYGGYYMIRTGWGRQDQWLYMPSTRPVDSLTLGNCNDIHLSAFGQNLLLAQHHSPITVDDCPQIDCDTYRNYPAKYRPGAASGAGILPANPGVAGWKPAPLPLFEPLYGKNNGAAAYDTVLKRRWHTSEHFDFCEGEYTGPFARNPREPGQPGVFIDDVTHKRQILFARKLGVWVVIDRVKSPSNHTYQLRWPIFGPQKEGGKDLPGFTDKQIVVDEKTLSIKTQNEAIPNLSIYHFSLTPLKIRRNGVEFAGAGEHAIVSLLYPRQKGAADLKEVKPADPLRDWAGLSAIAPNGTGVTCVIAPRPDLSGYEAELVVDSPPGEERSLNLGWPPAGPGSSPDPSSPFSNFESAQHLSDQHQETGKKVEFPIHVPMDMPVILPPADHFADEAQVTMSHNEMDTVIRYTLDGTAPSGSSPIYEKPITIRGTTVVKARAFRKGVTEVPATDDCTKVSALARAVYVKEPAREPAKVGNVTPGLAYACYEGEDAWPISAFNLASLAPAATGTTPEIFGSAGASPSQEAPGKKGDFGYAFVYTGYLDIPRDAVYSFHAPKEFIYPPVDAGYDLRVFLGNEEWYPATRRHNWGAWSLPLKAGKHAFKVVYIDQRKSRMHSEEFDEDYRWTGEKPELMISGPGLDKQPIPASMLCH